MSGVEGEAPLVLVLMGVSGAGKTTIADALHRRLGWEFRDADSFHPPENVEKMSRGLPLDDGDRRPWLNAIAAFIDERLAAGAPALVTCSALKRAYRDAILGGRRRVRLIYLKGDKPVIAARLADRRGHFMPPTLLDSQFAALEEPGADEEALVVSNDPAPEAIADEIVERLSLLPSGEKVPPRSGGG